MRVVERGSGTSLILLHGLRQDQVVGYRDTWARVEHYPGATFAALDTAGHNVHLDRPALAAGLVTDWLLRMATTDRATPDTV